MATESKGLIRVLGTNGVKGSPLLRPGVKNFIIDIDGVICEDVPNEEPWRMVTAAEIPGSKEQVNQWHEEGHIITFFTSRTDEHRLATINWLNEHGFKYHNVLFNKPRGGNYHYIDDKEIKATRFNGRFERELSRMQQSLNTTCVSRS